MPGEAVTISTTQWVIAWVLTLAAIVAAPDPRILAMGFFFFWAALVLLGAR